MVKEKEKHDKEKYQETVLDLFRSVLNSVQLKDIDFDKKLKGQDRIDFLKYCDYVYTSNYFEIIISNIYYPLILYAAKNAENYDVVTFNRATANGVQLIKDFFSTRSQQYQTEFLEKPEKPTEGKLFEPVGPPKID